ncbi:HAD-IA family hydrolase [Ideonella sp.]|uniref:HAD-IA family hydrolase n=1 Tax=Ideonella sp. TaxID=1929293 RepID=UPI0035AEB502
MAYDLISFDLDGTLVDSAAEIAEAANRALQDHGIARRPVHEITLLIGAGTRELMLKLLARAFLDQPALADRTDVDAVLASLDRHYAQTAGSSAAPYSGARAALVQLKHAGVKLACVSNKELRHLTRVLQATRLDAYFDLVVGGDSYEHKKPHAGVLTRVALELRVDTARMAHVGDSALDVQAARNAGVAAWAVPYGYNAGQPIEDAQPQRIFCNLLEVAAHALAQRRASPLETTACKT